jgi:hypothetical protein
MIDGAFANPQALGESGPVRALERGGNALLNAALQGGAAIVKIARRQNDNLLQRRTACLADRRATPGPSGNGTHSRRALAPNFSTTTVGVSL